MVDTKTKQEKAKKVNYVNGRDFHNEIVLSREQGELTKNAVTMIIKMANESSKILSYKYEEDREDCIAFGIRDVLLYWKTFDPDKGSNAFAYFTQIIKNGFAKGYNILHPIKTSNKISISNEKGNINF